MDLDGARNAKYEAFRKAFAYHEASTVQAAASNHQAFPVFLPNESQLAATVSAQLVRAARPRDDQLISVGIGRTRDSAPTDYELVIYCQRKSLRDHPIVEQVTKMAKAEVRVIVTGPFRRHSTSQQSTRRTRPLRLGVSVGHPRVTAGTLGCFVRLEPPAGIGLLSNNHVLAASNDADYGDQIIQPGRADGGNAANDVIGVLHQSVPLRFETGAVNFVDCAVATLAPGVAFDAGMFVDHEALGGVLLSEVNDAPDLRQTVTKYGRTTDRTHGEIVSIEQDNLWVNYSSRSGTKLARFDGQINIKGLSDARLFSKPGDSGSLIVDSSGRACALLFAGSQSGVTSANPIRAVLDALTCSIYV